MTTESQLQASGALLGAARGEILGRLLSPSHLQTAETGSGQAEGVLLPVADHLLSELRRALSWEAPALFVDCAAWAKAVLIQRGVPVAALTAHLEHVAAVLRRRLPKNSFDDAAGIIRAALREVADSPEAQTALLRADSPLTPLATLYFRALLRGDRQTASRLVLQAVESGTPVKEIYLHVFQPAQHELGRLWQFNRISVAEEHYATAATQLIMSQLYPQVFSSDKVGRTVVAACVSGDLHELGVRMVADFFEMAGWDSYYTGASSPMSAVLHAVVARRADVLAISATMNHHVEDVRSLIGFIRGHVECESVKVIVGGFPFIRDPTLWRQVGADGSGADAETAVVVGNGLVKTSRDRQ